MYISYLNIDQSICDMLMDKLFIVRDIHLCLENNTFIIVQL